MHNSHTELCSRAFTKRVSVCWWLGYRFSHLTLLTVEQEGAVHKLEKFILCFIPTAHSPKGITQHCHAAQSTICFSPLAVQSWGGKTAKAVGKQRALALSRLWGP